MLNRMHRRTRPALVVIAIALTGGLIFLAAGRRDADAREGARVLPRADVAVTVSATAMGPRLPPGFVGVSLEYPALMAYAGTNPASLNPLLVQLIRNLAPHQRPVLRIGGDSSDTTWWPSPGVRRPGGVTYGLSPRWLAVTRALARALDARLILGVDLEAGSPRLALAESRALSSLSAVQAIEIGNEAPRYRQFPWYHRSGGEPIFARPQSYGYASFSREFASVARLLPGRLRAAGPTLGGKGWMGNLGHFVAREPRLGLVTYHHYPTNRCFTAPGSIDYPTVPRLLTVSASRRIDPALTRYARIAGRHGLGLRVDEINSVACGGKRGVSDTLASALWALDTLFALTRTGIVGVNFHTFPGAAYALFRFRFSHGRWSARVAPMYYGLELFAEAAPAGARLLRVGSTAGSQVRAWATRTPAGVIHVVLINADLSQRHVVLLRLPSGSSAREVRRLEASSAYATTGVRLAASPALASSARGRYLVAVGPGSAAMATFVAR